MLLSILLKMRKAISSVSNKKTKSAKKSKISILMFLFSSVVLLSCNNTSTDSNATAKAIDEEIKLDSALMIPDFTISTIQDSTNFSSESIPKDGIFLIKYFSPDCDHCQNEATMYVSKKDSLANIKTIWISGDWASLKMIEEFYENYQLAQITPLAVGKDNSLKILSYYKISGVPFAAVYHDNQLIKEYKSALDFRELIAINNGTFVPNTADTTLQKEQEISSREESK